MEDQGEVEAIEPELAEIGERKEGAWMPKVSETWRERKTTHREEEDEERRDKSDEEHLETNLVLDESIGPVLEKAMLQKGRKP